MAIEPTSQPVGTPAKTMRAAAIQLEATLGGVAENLRLVEHLVDVAACRGAQLRAVLLAGFIATY